MGNGSPDKPGIADRLFRPDPDEMPTWLSALVRAGRLLFMIGSEFGKDRCATMAAGMAYWSLLALVPASAVFLAAFTAFGAFNDLMARLQEFLIRQTVPAAADTILEYLRTFTQNTKAVSAFGTIFLFVTTILVFNTIEQAFNHVYKSRRSRSLPHKIMAFTSVILWGPLLIGMSFWLTGKLRAALNVDVLLESTFGDRVIVFFTPLILSWLAFTLAFVVVPAARVRWRSALAGGAVSAILWEIAKVAFASYVPRAVTYNTLYGSLSVIPIFLIWLYYTWLILLVGLEVSYVHQNYESLVVNRRFADAPKGRERIHLALRFFAEIARSFRDGDGPALLDNMVDQCRVPLETGQELVQVLENQGLVVRADKDEESYVPARALTTVSVTDVVNAVYSETVYEGTLGADGTGTRMDDLLNEMERAARDSLDGLTFEAFLARGPG